MYEYLSIKIWLASENLNNIWNMIQNPGQVCVKYRLCCPDVSMLACQGSHVFSQRLPQSCWKTDCYWSSTIHDSESTWVMTTTNFPFGMNKVSELNSRLFFFNVLHFRHGDKYGERPAVVMKIVMTLMTSTTNSRSIFSIKTEQMKSEQRTAGGVFLPLNFLLHTNTRCCWETESSAATLQQTVIICLPGSKL